LNLLASAQSSGNFFAEIGVTVSTNVLTITKDKNMKTFILTAATCLSTLLSQAQIPNPGFEQWEEHDTWVGIYTDPKGWSTSNMMLLFSGISEAAATPSSDAYSGTYALQLRNIANDERMVGYASTMQNTALEFSDKFPIQGKATAFKGYYKYTYQEKDTFVISAMVYKDGNMIGSGSWDSDQQSTEYSLFNIPIEYFQGSENILPDSASIFISASAFGKEVMNETVTLLVDELSFEGVTTGTDDELVKLLSETDVFPIPAKNELTVAFKQPQRGTKTFKVYSVLGNEVTTLTLKREFTPGNHHIQLPVSQLAPGIYWLQVSEQNIASTIRFSVQP
jgi:hypothetical protein